MEKSDKEKLNAIYNEIVGEPEFGRKGMRKQLDENTQAIEDIKKNGVKVKYFWMGASAVGGAGATFGMKALWAKIAAIWAASPK